MIRGRPYHQNKPDTFNQLWTVEEQVTTRPTLLYSFIKKKKMTSLCPSFLFTCRRSWSSCCSSSRPRRWSRNDGRRSQTSWGTGRPNRCAPPALRPRRIRTRGPILSPSATPFPSPPQVASRVQKYFIKLTKAGIPVPGRTPNLCMYNKKVCRRPFSSFLSVALFYLFNRLFFFSPRLDLE